MPWAAAIGAVGAIGSAVIGSSASQGAANTQANASNNASAAELQMYNQNEANLQPYMGAGTNALSALQNFLGIGGSGPSSQTGLGTSQFTYNPANDPLYNFTMQQGTQAITNNASALGGVNSGATLTALQNYGQQTAQTSYQQEFNNWNTQLNNIFSRLSGVAGEGANAAAGVAGIGTTVAGQVGSNTIGAGNAEAAGTIGSANSISNGIQSLFSNQAIQNLLQQSQNGNTSYNNAFTSPGGFSTPTATAISNYGNSAFSGY